MNEIGLMPASRQQDGELRATQCVLWAALALAVIVQTWVGLQDQGIAEDGAYCLRSLLSRNRPSCMEPARWAVQFGFQAPALIAARWLELST